MSPKKYPHSLLHIGPALFFQTRRDPPASSASSETTLRRTLLATLARRSSEYCAWPKTCDSEILGGIRSIVEEVTESAGCTGIHAFAAQSASCERSVYSASDWANKSSAGRVSEETCAQMCLRDEACTGFELLHGDRCTLWLHGACSGPASLAWN